MIQTQVRPAAVACLAGAGAASWASLIAAPASRFAVVLALCTAPALLAVGARSRHATLPAIAVAVPSTLLAAGVSPGAHSAAGAWWLSAAMLGSGALWTAGALVGGSAVASSRRLAIGFLLLAAPWGAAVCQSSLDRAAWPGGIVLLAAVLWFSTMAVTIPLGFAAALLSVAIAQAVGPRTRWLGLGARPLEAAQFTSLDTEPTYGPLSEHPTGAPMLAVSAAQPALWRMQTLDYFDGSGWTITPDRLPELPQPAGRRRLITVRVLGLHQDLVVAPGRVEQVDRRASATLTGGEGWQLATVPRTGDSYRVLSSPVDVTAKRLAKDRAPLGPGALAYTRLGDTPARASGLQVLGWFLGSLGLTMGSLVNPTVDPRVVALAGRLRAGAQTEWEKVARVERFLLDGHRFRYTTQVPAPGPHPLVDFLLRTRAGYCQQFAGAAALLLRLSGVPARVVAGFATGVRTGPRQYTVRDLDAHDWIEVYFPRYGWVPFNPTPSASPAAIAPGLDLIRGSTLQAGRSGGLPDSALLYALAVGPGLGLLALRARGGSRRSAQPLERIANHVCGPLKPSMTLSQLAVTMAAIGPRTAALAAELEGVRFAPRQSADVAHPRARLARALVGDVGPVRALLIWLPLPQRVRARSAVSPAPDERKDQQRDE